MNNKQKEFMSIVIKVIDRAKDKCWCEKIFSSSLEEAYQTGIMALSITLQELLEKEVEQSFTHLDCIINLIKTSRCITNIIYHLEEIYKSKLFLSSGYYEVLIFLEIAIRDSKLLISEDKIEIILSVLNSLKESKGELEDNFAKDLLKKLRLGGFDPNAPLRGAEIGKGLILEGEKKW